MSTTKQQVQEYYGETLQQTSDLKTNACCTSGAPPQYIRDVLDAIHYDVTSRYYGCGLVIPEALEGLKVLDLGCGAGQDVYILSALVGESGSVVGVDMTPKQLEIAEKHKQFHADQFKYAESNVTFIEGELEKLDELGLEPESFDLIVSNCVLNLCVDKEGVLRHAYNLLKPGGELYFSDVYCDRRIPEELSKDPVLYGECLSGAFYWNDFLRSAKKSGFIDPRLESDSEITIANDEVQEKVGDILFFSATYRLFKIDLLETECEDYGQAVIYKGTIPQHPNHFTLDKHHNIQKGKVFPVCGNTYRMLHDTRFNSHFDFIGTWDTHYGIFDGCGTSLPYDQTGAAGVCAPSGGGCC